MNQLGRLNKLQIIAVAVLLIAIGIMGYNLNQNHGMALFEVPKHDSTIFLLNNSMTSEEVKADFDYFMSIVENDYPFLEVNQRLNGINFLENKERYWQTIKNAKTKAEFADILTKIMEDLNNGHTNIIDFNNQGLSRDYYYRIYSNIRKQSSEYNILYKPWMDTLENEASIKLYGELPQLAESDASGKGDENRESILENNVITNDVAQGKIIYIKIKSFNYFNEATDKMIILDHIKEHINAQALVIDIRENGGGSTEYYKNILVEPLLIKSVKTTHYNLMRSGENNKPIIEAIEKANPGVIKPMKDLNTNEFENAKPEVYTKFDYYIKSDSLYEPKSSIGFKGKIYVLTSSNVFSASESFAAFCKDTKFAVLIGQKTGGDGFGMDPALFCLPNSGILGRYPLQYGMNGKGECNEEMKTQPDYFIDNVSVKDNLMIDECIKKVIELEHL